MASDQFPPSQGSSDPYGGRPPGYGEDATHVMPAVQDSAAHPPAAPIGETPWSGQQMPPGNENPTMHMPAVDPMENANPDHQAPQHQAPQQQAPQQQAPDQHYGYGNPQGYEEQDSYRAQHDQQPHEQHLPDQQGYAQPSYGQGQQGYADTQQPYQQPSAASYGQQASAAAYESQASASPYGDSSAAYGNQPASGPASQSSGSALGAPQPSPHGVGYTAQVPPPATKQDRGDGNPLTALFDFSFSRYATPGLVKVVYILAMAASVMWWLGSAILTIVAGLAINDYTGEGTGSIIFGVLILLFGWIPALLNIALVRVFLEFALATVRSSNRVAEIADCMDASKS